jgi:hypothetical protein
MGAGEDKDRLISVGQQDLLVLSLRARIEPDDSLLPFFDLFDHPGAVFQNRNTDPVADGYQISRPRTAFQPPAQLANEKALTGLYGKETRLGPDDQTMQ